VVPLLIGAALAHATAPSGSAEPSASITAPGGQVRASQIAMLPAARDTIVATLPEGAGEVTMTADARLALIRNRYPGAAYRLRHDGPVRVLREAVAPETSAECAASRAEIPAGAYLSEDDLAPVRCQDGATGGWLGYDPAARGFFARVALRAGTYLGRVPVNPQPSATEGRQLVYRTSEGPVMVEREVVALQSGRAGRPVFVRTEEGKVLAATVAGAEDGE